MSKKTIRNTPQKPVKSSASTGLGGRRLVWIVTGGVLVLAAAWYFFLYNGNKGSKMPKFTEDSGSEETLVAKNPRLQLLSSSETGIDFKNYILEDATHNIILNLNQYNGGGLAVADINNDQLPDVYFISCSGKNQLFLNQGNFKFKDITDSAGVGSEGGFETSATAADVNADGWLDFFVCRAGPDEAGRVCKLFINNHDLTFTERAEEFGLADKGPCSTANFFDYDNDGDLDCYIVNHPLDFNHANRLTLKFGPDGKTTVPDLDPKEPYDDDHLYRNDKGKFVNVSKEAGIRNFGFGLSASVSDFNGDGWPDIYVGNDYVQPDNLYINNQKGGFTDQMSHYFTHNSMSAMGADLSDFDNDGRVDLMTVDMFPATAYRQKLLRNTNQLSRYLTMVKNGYFRPVARNVLQHNNGNGTFSDIACLAGVYKTDWSWSCQFADLDNDGWKDLHIANGYRREVTNRDYMDFYLPEVTKTLNSTNKDVFHFNEMLAEYKVRNFVFRNTGNLQFEDKSGDWMTMPGSWSCGSAWADFDGDGDLDLVVNNLEDPAFVYKNLTREQGGGNYLQAKLQGSPDNPFAVGASVLIEYQGNMQYMELNPAHGIYSSVEHLIHFGVGQASTIDKVTVRWPDGKTQTWTNVPVNQRLNPKWTDASGYVAHLIPPVANTPTLFKEKPAQASGVDYQHIENSFSDFETWVLNPWTITDMGPLLAKADVNGDGLEDFFIGNGAGQAPALYLQTAGVAFRQSSAATWEKDKASESHGALFFDADGDHDKDLMVLSGGAEIAFSAQRQARLYLNDGKGNFSKWDNALPELKDVGLRLSAYDYDGDGDEDIFIGGRVVPRNWPLTPQSQVWRNDLSQNNTFSNVTEEVGGDFEKCGMVTDLSWQDLNGDGQKELIVVGEWMPVTVFQWKDKRLQNVTEQFGLTGSNGFWNKIVCADMDKDGDMDLVTGNLGLNSRFTASDKAPFCCFAKDFDKNGAIDPIVAFYEGGKLYPLMQKEVVVKQIPSLKKRFLYNRDYAKATVSDLFGASELESALKLQIFTFETCWWENSGGKFIRHSLPLQAQVSPVQGIACEDFNGDGNPDILMAGNKYGFEVETNPCDASTGALFLGDGKGNFQWVNGLQSGFWAPMEARDLITLTGPGGKRTVVVSNNNGKTQTLN